jgi:hypothetical protein
MSLRDTLYEAVGKHFLEPGQRLDAIYDSSPDGVEIIYLNSNGHGGALLFPGDLMDMIIEIDKWEALEKEQNNEA